MYIKNIIISGFRSYREQSFDEELSPKHNVIVGKNGSGKSNFFAAVQFVLSEKFADLRASERKDLFHVGSGRPSLSVFVEIVFDNTDGRMVIPGRQEEPEVRIRRTLGLKQDEFRVNDRKYSASEVRQLLVSAGFSSANPYYIVEQGKIVNLANMTEVDRYQLLKDVAGTKVYEARREESSKILAQTALQAQQVNDAIAQLDGRLKELEAESSELKAFQEADKKRKSLEYCIFTSELNAANQQLDQTAGNWEEKLEAADKARDSDQALRDQVAETEREIDSTKKRILELEHERKQIDKEKTACLSRRAIADLNAKDAASATTRDEEERKALVREEKDLQSALSKAEGNHTTKSKALKAATDSVESVGKQLTESETRLEVLQAKRGRKIQFKSKGERDTWLHAEIKRNEEVIKGNNAEIANFKKESKRLEETIARDKNDAQKHGSTMKNKEKELSEAVGQRDQFIEKRDKLNVERRSLWQKVNDQEGVVNRLTDDVARTQNKFDRVVRNDIRQGYQSLQETLREINDPKLTKAVHGQVIELCEVDPAFRTAVEVTAGNALFNVVVDSFATSARLLDHFNRKRKAGRVTFFPLDTLKPTPKELPNTAQCSALVNHVKFESKFTAVFNEMFARTAVVPSIDNAVNIVRELDTDVVTMDGDQFSRKGGITGGYVEKGNMKISAYLANKAANKELVAEKLKLSNMCQSVSHCEQRITEAVQEIERINSQDVFMRGEADNERYAMRLVEEVGARLEQQKAHIAESISNLEKQNLAIAATNGQLEKEFATDFKEGLSAKEEEELEKLQVSVTKMRNEFNAAHKTKISTATEVQLLQDTKHHLERRLVTVRDRVETITRTQKLKTHTAQAKEVASIDNDLKVMTERMNQAEAKIDQHIVKRQKLEDQADAVRRKLLQTTRAHQEQKDTIEVAHNQRALLVQKKEDAQSKIRKLGVIPTDADKYISFSAGKLMHLLKQANEELKKHDHVNKKALDQYNALVEARTDLHERRETLKQELASIEKLMAHLDQQKDEAILRTYKQVQYQFEEVFKELVSADGVTADLQLVKSSDKNSADPFSEVRVCVCFGLGTATAELGQLSGGQKSLVALALIFAIQRCDPAPFYLFDEIDAALDAEYRTSVARMLATQSANCQFITASFKNEMLEVADRVYGIFFHNKVSRIQMINQDEGASLLRQAAQEDRKRKRHDDVESIAQ